GSTKCREDSPNERDATGCAEQSCHHRCDLPLSPRHHRPARAEDVMSADDLAAANRQLRDENLRLREDLQLTRERWGYALDQIAELRRRVPDGATQAAAPGGLKASDALVAIVRGDQAVAGPLRPFGPIAQSGARRYGPVMFSVNRLSVDEGR